MKPEIAKLTTTEHRLREVIRTLVKRRARGVPLTWRLMFEIEDEAIGMLQQDPEVDFTYLNLMASPSAQRRQDRDEPAHMGNLYAMHTALWMIQEAYYHPH
jgi:hypothetical protein